MDDDKTMPSMTTSFGRNRRLILIVIGGQALVAIDGLLLF